MVRCLIAGILCLAAVAGADAQFVCDAHRLNDDPFGSNGLSGFVSFDDGVENRLFAWGRSGLAYEGVLSNAWLWDGSDWVDSSIPVPSVGGVIVADFGFGEGLYAVGRRGRIAQWSAGAWNLIQGAPLLAESVNAVVAFDDGTGLTVYVGANFSLSTPAIGHVYRWANGGWEQVGGEFRSFTLENSGPIQALAVHDDGTGPSLYAGGDIRKVQVDGVFGAPPLRCITRWDGNAWVPVGEGFGISDVYTGFAPDSVSGLASYTDSMGTSRLYATGFLFSSDGAPLNGIASWDGTAWTGPGLGQITAIANQVTNSVVHDDGRGPRLWATADWSSSDLASWDGQNWEPVPLVAGVTRFSIGSVEIDGEPALVVSQIAPVAPFSAVTFVEVRRCLPCSRGAVGWQDGGPFNVLSAGGSFGPEVSIPLGVATPLQVDQPPTTAAPAPFVISGRLGPVTENDATVLPFDYGTMCFPPSALSPPGSGSFVLTSNLFPSSTALIPSAPAPWGTLLPALGFPLLATLQGVIQDDSDPQGLAVTNALTLSIGL